MKKMKLSDLLPATAKEVGESLQRAVGEPVQCLLVCSQPHTDELDVGVFNLTKAELKVILLSMISEMAEQDQSIQISKENPQ